MSSDVAIKVENLTKCYQIYATPRDRLKQFILPRLQRFLGLKPRQYFEEFWALREMNFTIKKGETVGIIGRNGAGKSTLLQMVCGTLTPTHGHIVTNGRVAALLELGSGFNPEFSGRENVYLNASILGLTYAEVEQRFNDIVAFADIGDFIDQPVKTYSSGMMLRLAFAVIAHVDADILVIDEALSVGDAFFTQKCMRFLRQFMKKGTILFVSHDTSSVRNLCKEAIWLEQGQVLQHDTAKIVCENYLEAFYEQQQGKSTTTRIKNTVLHNQHPVYDQRTDFINASNLRNDIQVFQFDPEAPSFGKGAAHITAVRFLDKRLNPLAWIVGGEEVFLQIDVRAEQALTSPIIGFYVKDHLGQTLFGDNTYLTYVQNPVSCAAGKMLTAHFSFQMPRLAAGDYSLTAAVAEGTQENHVQHHWIHDAIVFKSESTSVSGGLIGIPMTDIQLRVEEKP